MRCPLTYDVAETKVCVRFSMLVGAKACAYPDVTYLMQINGTLLIRVSSVVSGTAQ
jgi:hypothetical protein